MFRNLRPGFQISFVSDDGEKVQGELLCHDEARRFLMLQRPAQYGPQNTFDILMYRHDNIKDLVIHKTSPVANFPELDLEKIALRSSRNEQIEQERLKLYEPDVPKDARALFEHLSKTLPTAPKWEKPNIMVLEQTIIKNPYLAEFVTSKSESAQAVQEREYVQKLVDKFYTERITAS